MKVQEYDLRLREDGTCYLHKHGRPESKSEYVYVDTPDAIYEFMESQYKLSSLAYEVIYMIAVNTKSRILGVFPISMGTVDVSILSPRDVLMRALLVGAKGIILVHNHPSGIPLPSTADIDSTRRVKEAAQLMNINLLDHIIIGKYLYSMSKNGEI